MSTTSADQTPKSSRRLSVNIVLIRPATPSDIPLIRELEQQSETAAHWAERDYDALFAPEAPKRVALVAAEEGGREIYGFAVARCGADEWEIENVVVAVGQRRRGIGSRLVRQILQAARDSGAGSVLLEVRESNVAARQLYEKLGFIETGRRASYYREPP